MELFALSNFHFLVECPERANCIIQYQANPHQDYEPHTYRELIHIPVKTGIVAHFDVHGRVCRILVDITVDLHGTGYVEEPDIGAGVDALVTL